MLRAYRYRIYPTAEQRVLLEKHFGCCRFIYNWGLQRKIEEYQKTGKGLDCFDLIKELPALKNEFEWLKEVTADSLQQAVKHLDCAFTQFFQKKSKYPKFKSKHASKPAYSIPTDVRFETQSLLKIPKMDLIRIRGVTPFVGKIKTTTISRTPTHKYYASILVETPDSIPPKPKIEPETSIGIGLDLGLTHFCTLSTGEKVENPRHLKKSLKRIKFQSRRLSRKQKGSKRREKQKLVVAKLHETVANRRTDFLHKLSHRLTHENQVNTICVEDLNVEGMKQNRCLAQRISDVSWSKFTEYLQYKCDWYGKNLVKIGRFEPSSKMCTCGKINSALTLDQRSWKCVYCGVTHDRDMLAANNIKRFALQKTNLLRQASQELFVGQEVSESTLGESVACKGPQ